MRQCEGPGKLLQFNYHECGVLQMTFRTDPKNRNPNELDCVCAFISVTEKNRIICALAFCCAATLPNARPAII